MKIFSGIQFSVYSDYQLVQDKYLNLDVFLLKQWKCFKWSHSLEEL